MTTFLSLTPADTSLAYQIIDTPGDQTDLLQQAMLRSMRWKIVLLEQDSDIFTFGAPATVIVDLGEVPADLENFYDGDPEWGTLHARIEVAGYDAGPQVWHDGIVPFSMWMSCDYMAPQRGVSMSALWNGDRCEIDDDGTIID
jgi:hypothetical protein